MGVNWDVLNQQADDARQARQERERNAEEAKKRAFIMLIDEVVDAGVRKGLDAHKMQLVEQWAINLKTRLGLNEGHTVHSALFDLTGETTAIRMISGLQNAIDHGGPDSLTAVGANCSCNSNLPTLSDSWAERFAVQSRPDTPLATPRGSTVVTLESWASKLAVKPTVEVTGSSETGSKV